jgi:hypothetical protein
MDVEEFYECCGASANYPHQDVACADKRQRDVRRGVCSCGRSHFLPVHFDVVRCKCGELLSCRTGKTRTKESREQREFARNMEHALR